MPTPSLNESIQKNQGNTCSVPGCYYHRYKLYNTCVHHYFKRKLHGHPSARAIRKGELLYEKSQVTSLIERNMKNGHPGILKAIEWIDRWIEDAVDNRPGVIGRHHLKRLYEGHKTGLDVLIVCATIWLFSDRNPKYFPGNLVLTYALTHQMMTLVPLERIIGTRSGKSRVSFMNGTDRRTIGEHIRKHLGLLFVNICSHLDKQEENEYYMQQDLCKRLG